MLGQYPRQRRDPLPAIALPRDGLRRAPAVVGRQPLADEDGDGVDAQFDPCTRVAVSYTHLDVYKRQTLERFDCSHSPSVNHALIAELATCRFVLEQAPVLIAGPTGTGKSPLDVYKRQVYAVSLETSGALDIGGVDQRVSRIVDLKAVSYTHLDVYKRQSSW